jgi:hypothetical protein
MVDLSGSNSRDPVAICLEQIRQFYFDGEGWSDLQGVIAETVQEFGPLPRVDVSDYPDWPKLNNAEREKLASYITELANRLRAPLLMALIAARVQLCVQGRNAERTQQGRSRPPRTF